MSDTTLPRRQRLADRLRALLYHALSLPYSLDGEPLRVSADNGVYRVSLLLEAAAPAAAAAATQAPLPVPLPYSAEELADMLAIGPAGAMLVKNVAARRGVRGDDPRLRQRLQGLEERKALGHCKDGYFWANTNPHLLPDAAEAPT